jgi:uncharacterized protein (TIGR02646 family)
VIKIDKPKKAPVILSAAGAIETKKNCDSFDKDENLFIQNLKIISDIYGHNTVKRALIKAQNNKCCYCEKSQVDEYGDVEHFRPKKGYKQKKGSKALVPGYYWLAYNWDNLFFACNVCNRSYKSTLFPLIDENKRAKNHSQNINDEEPFLINPGIEIDIMSHITFNSGQIIGISPRGKRTIKICGLDRSNLDERRSEHISNIDARMTILASEANFSKEEIDKARAYIHKCMSSKGEFSAMSNLYIKKEYNIVTIP